MIVKFLIILQLITVLQLKLSTAKYTRHGKCGDKPRDGARCFAQRWQFDGVCLYKKGKLNECVSPIASKFEFTIEARYQSLTKKSRGKPVKKMFLRGSGPGLSWDKSIEMKKSAREVDVWAAEIHYGSDAEGLFCRSPTHCNFNQGAVEFRIYRDEQAKDGMKGANFYIPLPVSKSRKNSRAPALPKVKVYPWFNNERSLTKSLDYKISLDILGDSKEMKFKGTLIYPPSFKENIYKCYPLVVLLDDAKHYIPQFDYLSVQRAAIEEILILMISPHVSLEVQNHANYTILPFDSYSLECKSRKKCSECQSCWNSGRVEVCDKEEFIMRSKKCLYFKHNKGIGDALLTRIIKDLTYKVKEMTGDRVKFDPPRERISLMGYGDRAVAAFMMGLNRPDLIANVASISPKFFLPLTSKYTNKFETIKRMDDLALTFASSIPLQGLYATQKYYIDHGENDDINLPLDSAIQATEKVIEKLKTSFKMEEGKNLMFQVTPGEGLVYPKDFYLPMISHLQSPLLYFYKAQGGPSGKHSRTIKLSEEFFAEQKPKTEVLSNTNASNPVEVGFTDAERDGGLHFKINECSNQSKEVPIVVFFGSIGEVDTMHMHE